MPASIRTAGLVALLLTLVGAARAIPPEAPSPQTPPRLVVLVVVDQLPAYLLERLDPAFTGGFRTLIDQGFRWVRATHDHAITETAPGHATLATGTEPARHGVVANAWRENVNGQVRVVTNVVDPEAPVLGVPGLAGASPRVLRRDGLADWLLSAHPDARVVAVSGKDRGAVLLAGRTGGDPYWFDPVVGRFVTSEYYREAYPAWVDGFNDEVIGPLVADTVWTVDVPAPLRPFARADTFPFEGDGLHTAFPHRFADVPVDEEGGPPSFWEWWLGTPSLDRATLALARRAVEAEDLGGDEVPDLLAVSLSQTDRVGHGYGPGSLEQLDNLLRLDRELGEFIAWLDQRFGRDGYVMALSSDHGVLEFPEVRRERGEPSVRLTNDSLPPLQALLDRAQAEATAPGELALRLSEALPGIPWIDRAWVRASLADGEPTDSFTRLQRANFVPERMPGLLSRGGVEFQYAEGVLPWAYPNGTGHGTPWYYDRHVPLIFFGDGIEAGESADRASAVDLAPTLADYLGIPWPDDLDGRSLRR